MVARIRSGKSICGAVNYNECKVKLGKAELLMANGYHKDPILLGFSEKVNRLQRLADLNTRVTTNCLHLSLNFDPTEKLTNDKLRQIAEQYMQGIGFGEQPYLVYLHEDAAHQHIHIVSTNIQKHGTRISMHRLGADASEKTRKEIEIGFGLKKAGTVIDRTEPCQLLVNAGKLEYGQVPTKRAISNIVTEVVNGYKYASIAELNAVLGFYNVYADRGDPKSQMYKWNGLQYMAIAENGKKVGVPIKASSIYGSPTLKKLEARFEKNRVAKLAYRGDVQQRLSSAIAKAKTKEELTTALASQHIAVIYRENDQGYLYGITYIDMHSKTVFNGSQLGKGFSMAAVQKNCEANSNQIPAPFNITPKGAFQSSQSQMFSRGPQQTNREQELHSEPLTANQTSLLDVLTDSFTRIDYTPFQLKKKKRRKKKKKI